FLCSKVRLYKKDIDMVNKRRYQRIPTSFPCSLSIADSGRHQMEDDAGYGSQSWQNESMVVTATIIDLSEGGMFADSIIVFNPETDEEIDHSEIMGNKLRSIEFRLNGNPELIKIGGEFVRQLRNSGNLCAAVRFEYLSNDTKKSVKEYVDSQVSGNNGVS
ncbi:MAG: PilZ domain-containing protein, partial [Candidatus Anammoxibacter sp.]